MKKILNGHLLQFFCLRTITRSIPTFTTYRSFQSRQFCSQSSNCQNPSQKPIFVKFVPGPRLFANNDVLSHDPIVVLFDLEATGLSLDSEIIQIAAKVLGSEDSSKSFNIYVKPTVPLSTQIISLTGITQSVVDDNGVSFASAFSLFRNWSLNVRSSIGDGCRPLVFVAHNCKRYDQPVLNSNILRMPNCEFVYTTNGTVDWFKTKTKTEITDAKDNCGVANEGDVKYFLLDSLIFFRQKDVWRKRGEKDETKIFSPTKYNLGALYEHLTGQELLNGHNAIYDVEALEKLFLAPSIKNQWRAKAKDLLFI